MKSRWSRGVGAAPGRSRWRWATATLLPVAILAAGVQMAAAATPDDPEVLACSGDVGDPVSGTAEWNEADLNNQQCSVVKERVLGENPARAAATEANIAAGERYLGDPFGSPKRWGGERGSYELTTFTDRDGAPRSAALFGPIDAKGGPYPGIVMLCHACGFNLTGGPNNTVDELPGWYWAAEALAEAGYVVLYAEIFGNSSERAVDAADFFAATPDAPSPSGEFNPWHKRLDRRRLGIVGHSGAGGVAITVGNSDPRFDAVVAWDPAGSFTMAGITPQTPTMIQLADYPRSGAVPAPEKPTPAPGSKYTFFDTFRDAGVDTMQIAVRASTHEDWTGATGSIYGQQTASYYTRAWFDRYLAPKSSKTLKRLAASGTQKFDPSADVLSFGVGFFNEAKAERAGDPEAGNVPITIGGLRIRNLLSFHYDSRYFLNGGAVSCEDMRAGCASR